MGNNGPEFFQTRMGRVFYEHHIPSIAKSLDAIAKSLNTEVKEEKKEISKELIQLGDLKLKIYQNNTDKKGLCIDVVIGDEEIPLLLVEEENKELSIYCWEDKNNEDFTTKMKIQL